MAIKFPEIDPVAFSAGPVEIRWYALAYLAGFILGWQFAMYIARKGYIPGITSENVDNFFPWAILAVIIGGRLGYILFYNLGYYMENPGDMIKVWHGGMSFHGGLAGMIFAMCAYSFVKKLPLLGLSDIVACVAPIGLFFGRIANFINAELFGRPTQQPWGVIFPNGGSLARHPSQLYEAALEGLALFSIMLLVLWRSGGAVARGLMSGIFLAGYGTFRFLVEYVREPDYHIGLIGPGVSMGQILSLPLVLLGLALIVWSLMQNKQDRNTAN